MGRVGVTQVSLAMETESICKDSSKLRVAQLWTISTVGIECLKNNDLEEVERNCQEQNSVTESEILRHSASKRLSSLFRVIYYQLLLHTLSSFFPTLCLQHDCVPACKAPGTGQAEQTEGKGGGPSSVRRLPKEAGRLPQSFILNSQECVTTPEPGQGVPESPGSRLGADTVLSLPASIFMIPLSSPHPQPKCL